MELRKKKNITYNFKLSSFSLLENEEDNNENDEEKEKTSVESSSKANSKSNKSKSKRKRNTDSEYEYTSNNDSKSGTSSIGSKASSTKNKKKKSKKKYEIYDLESDLEDDTTINSAYDPIIQQNPTITTPLRTLKKVKFNKALNEVIDLVGDSDEEVEVITILDSEDDKDIIVETIDLTKTKKKGSKKKQKKKDTVLIDLIEDQNTDKKQNSVSDAEKSESEKSNSSSARGRKKRKNDNNENIDIEEEEEEEEEEININKLRKQKRTVISDEYNSDSNSNNSNKRTNLRSQAKKQKTNSSSDEKHGMDNNIVIELGQNNNNSSNIENIIDDGPSSSIESIEISSDDSDDDVIQINTPKKKYNDYVEVSDDNKSAESSMKKSISLRSSRNKKKTENRLLTLKRLKERKRKPIDSINPYEDIIGNEDTSSEEEVRPLRYLTEKNDDFIVSDSGNEEVYFLTTKWDIKQRKKLYKAFKLLYRFCIAILINEGYIKKNINDLRKAYQIINKRINYVCKKITPVPPWDSKFQTYIDSYPSLSVKSQYPKNRCESCRKNITSTFAVTFSGSRYNKVSLKDIDDKESKNIEKHKIFVIDRVCLERAQIYHELYHFKYNTLKEIEQQMKEKGLNISELKKSNKEDRVETTFEKLKTNCKENYVKLSEKLKKGESYVPNVLDV